MRRDASITVYGRMPVLEALLNGRLTVTRVLLAANARGDHVDDIVDAAGRRGVAVKRVSPEQVTKVSRNGKQDQGVVADVRAPGLRELGEALREWPPDSPLRMLVLDGVTNPANVGMIVRTATAAGLDGVVLPRYGSPDVGPLVVKASAGVVFAANVLRSATAPDALECLVEAGVAIYGLRADDSDLLFDAALAPRATFVLGRETDGVSADSAALVGQWLGLPMAPGVDSLNVASAAAVLAFELVRREHRP